MYFIHKVFDNLKIFSDVWVLNVDFSLNVALADQRHSWLPFVIYAAATIY